MECIQQILLLLVLQQSCSQHRSPMTLAVFDPPQASPLRDPAATLEVVNPTIPTSDSLKSESFRKFLLRAVGGFLNDDDDGVNEDFDADKTQDPSKSIDNKDNEHLQPLKNTESDVLNGTNAKDVASQISNNDEHVSDVRVGKKFELKANETHIQNNKKKNNNNNNNDVTKDRAIEDKNVQDSKEKIKDVSLNPLTENLSISNKSNVFQVTNATYSSVIDLDATNSNDTTNISEEGRDESLPQSITFVPIVREISIENNTKLQYTNQSEPRSIGLTANTVSWLEAILYEKRNLAWVVINTIFMIICVLLGIFALYRLLGLPLCSILLTRTLYLIIHLLLFTAAVFRAVHLLHLSYGSHQGLPLFLTLLLTHTPTPCLIGAITIMLHQVCAAAKVSLLGPMLPPLMYVGGFSSILILYSFIGDIIIGASHSSVLLLIIRLALNFAAVFTLTLYIISYKSIQQVIKIIKREFQGELKLLVIPINSNESGDVNDVKKLLKERLSPWSKSVLISCCCGLVMCLSSFSLSMFFTASYVPISLFWLLHVTSFIFEILVITKLSYSSMLTLNHSCQRNNFLRFVWPTVVHPTQSPNNSLTQHGNFTYQRVPFNGAISRPQTSTPMPIDCEIMQTVPNNNTIIELTTPPSRAKVNLRRSATFNCPPQQNYPIQHHRPTPDVVYPILSEHLLHEQSNISSSQYKVDNSKYNLDFPYRKYHTPNYHNNDYYYNRNFGICRNNVENRNRVDHGPNHFSSLRSIPPGSPRTKHEPIRTNQEYDAYAKPYQLKSTVVPIKVELKETSQVMRIPSHDCIKDEANMQTITETPAKLLQIERRARNHIMGVNAIVSNHESQLSPVAFYSPYSRTGFSPIRPSPIRTVPSPTIRTVPLLHNISQNSDSVNLTLTPTSQVSQRSYRETPYDTNSVDTQISSPQTVYDHSESEDHSTSYQIESMHSNNANNSVSAELSNSIHHIDSDSDAVFDEKVQMNGHSSGSLTHLHINEPQDDEIGNVKRQSMKRNHSIADVYPAQNPQTSCKTTDDVSSNELNDSKNKYPWYGTWAGRRKPKRCTTSVGPQESDMKANHNLRRLSSSKSSLSNLYERLKPRRTKSVYQPRGAPVNIEFLKTPIGSENDKTVDGKSQTEKDKGEEDEEEYLPSVTPDADFTLEILKSSRLLSDFYCLKESELEDEEAEMLNQNNEGINGENNTNSDINGSIESNTFSVNNDNYEHSSITNKVMLVNGNDTNDSDSGFALDSTNSC